MRCIIKYIMWGLVAITLGISIALLFPLGVIAGIEAVIVIILAILICCKK